MLAPREDGVEERLRSWIAAGADAVATTEVPDGAGDVSVAGLLAGTAKQLGADVVLVRHRTSELESCLIGPAAAELLGWAGIMSVIRADLPASGKLHLRRLVGDEIEHIECPTPAVLAVARGPRLPYPTLRGRHRARIAAIEELGAVSVMHNALAAAVPMEVVREAAGSATSDEERFVESPATDAPARPLDVIEGTPDEVAAKLAEVCRRALVG